MAVAAAVAVVVALVGVVAVAAWGWGQKPRNLQQQSILQHTLLLLGI